MALSIHTGVQQFGAFINRMERTNNDLYDIDWEPNLFVGNGNEDAKCAIPIFDPIIHYSYVVFYWVMKNPNS